MELPPITHEPHSFMAFLPEYADPISLAICEGRCDQQRTQRTIARYRAAGVNYRSVPGVHWWSEHPAYAIMQTLVFLQRDRYEGNTKQIEWAQARLVTLHKELNSAIPNHQER